MRDKVATLSPFFFYMKINSPGLAGSAGDCIAKARLAGESGPKASRQAMDGLSAGLGGQPIRPQRSSRRESRPALPTTVPIFMLRCDHQSWRFLYENESPGAGRFCRRLHREGPAGRRIKPEGGWMLRGTTKDCRSAPDPLRFALMYRPTCSNHTTCSFSRFPQAWRTR